jgi:hypothetical protein
MYVIIKLLLLGLMVRFVWMGGRVFHQGNDPG